MEVLDRAVRKSREQQSSDLCRFEFQCTAAKHCAEAFHVGTRPSTAENGYQGFWGYDFLFGPQRGEVGIDNPAGGTRHIRTGGTVVDPRNEQGGRMARLQGGEVVPV